MYAENFKKRELCKKVHYGIDLKVGSKQNQKYRFLSLFNSATNSSKSRKGTLGEKQEIRGGKSQ